MRVRLKSLTTTSGQERKKLSLWFGAISPNVPVYVPVTSPVVPTLSCTARASMKADGRSASVANLQQSPMPLKKVKIIVIVKRKLGFWKVGKVD
ncbi:hypothetical protein CEXT_672051 [Caerostris extrusa]|uniref:Uncharacterized protein n=1 Tax=Caerostris extrusa TaxID=172846 RepID=A0AAV4RK49_CAEEX|nr:hypothetical protein CEXT_672051 [Caerostris extrusa]